MDRSKAEILLNKYNCGKASPIEIAILESWYLEEGIKTPLFEGVVDYESKRLSILSKIQQHRQPVRKITKLWARIAISAVIATIICGTGMFFYKNQQNGATKSGQVTNEIAPGRQGATLTLANGKKIRLSDAVNGELAKEDGVTITKSAEGQLVYQVKGTNTETNKINTLSTAKGETYKVILPDGSSVWLNAASTLSYPASFTALKFRRVELKGEAYFEVAHNKDVPFSVVTDHQTVLVLGTHFNISSYPDQPVTQTTLVQGSVLITAIADNGSSQQLRPGQQATLKAGKIRIRDVDTDSAIAWKDGMFLFDEEPLEDIMEKLSRWYSVDIEYRDNAVRKELYSGGFSRYSRISQVLSKLEKTGGVKFTIEKGKVIVIKD